RDLLEPGDRLEYARLDMALAQRAVVVLRPRPGLVAAVVLAAQHPLGQGREGDDPDPQRPAGIDGAIILDPAVEDRIARLMDGAGNPHLAEKAVRLARLLFRIARNADIERLAGMYR